MVESESDRTTHDRLIILGLVLSKIPKGYGARDAPLRFFVVGSWKAPPVCMMYVIIPGTEYQVASLVNAIRLEDDVILLETVPCPHVNHVK